MGSEANETIMNRLQQSEAARWFVAQWLSSHGYPVWLGAVRYAPDVEHWEEYADDGDIHMGLRIETKRRPTMNFTCAKDFQYDTFMVCGKNSFDRADPKPLAYVTLNSTMTYAGITFSDTAGRWKVRRVKDSQTGLVQDVYEAPLELVTFTKVEFKDRPRKKR